MVSVSSGLGPEIHGRSPDVGVSRDLVTVNITGSRFEDGIVASLEKDGEGEINADTTVFISPDTINATFDLDDALEGIRNLKVTNPDSDSYVFYEGFKVIAFLGDTIPFGSWENFRVEDETSIKVGVRVPNGIDDLFILIKKTTHIGYAGTWSGSVRVLKHGIEIGFQSGNDDFNFHIQEPAPGWYTMEIWSSDPGEGLIKACSALDTLQLKEWKIGEVLRPYGCDWMQLDIPSNQDSLFFQTEGFGLWSTLDVYHGYLGNQDEHWQFSHMGAGYHIEGGIENPPGGMYYLRYMDSAVMQGTTDQTRQYMIIADTESIPGPPPSKPIITDLSTYRGGTAGPVTVIISGAGLDSAATVYLAREEHDSVLADYVVGDSTMRSLGATFDLSATALGEWTLIVTNPDAQSATASNTFVVETSGEPELWVEIVGRKQLRVNRPQTYVIRYGNEGAIDAKAVSIPIRIPKNVMVQVLMEALLEPFVYDPNIFPSAHDSETVVIEACIGDVPVDSRGAFKCVLTTTTSSLTHFKVEARVTENIYLLEETLPRSELLCQSGKSEYSRLVLQEIMGVTLWDQFGFVLSPRFKQMGRRHPFYRFRGAWYEFTTTPTTRDGYVLVKRRTDAQFSEFMYNHGAGGRVYRELIDGDYVKWYETVFEPSPTGIEIEDPTEAQIMKTWLDFYADEGLEIKGNCITAMNEFRRHIDLPPFDMYNPSSSDNEKANEFTEYLNIDPADLPSRFWLDPPSVDLREPKTADEDLFQGSSHLEITVVSSTTPEDKYGPTGYDLSNTLPENLSRFVPSSQNFQYRIDFWNKEDATAPAQEAFVVDTLDTNFVDSTFAFTEFGFLRWTIPLKGGQYFNVDVDMRPDTLIVNVEGKYDQDTREISWTFRSLDPETRELPEDPMAGFLPPIDSTGYQIGWVDFAVRPRPGLCSGTIITNQAFVNFDRVGPWNPAPKEAPYLNTIDAGPPSSSVLALRDTIETLQFTVNWTGVDDDTLGSGIRSYSIYYSEDDDSLFVPWLIDTTATSAEFTGEDNHKYCFYSIARDNVGYVEVAPDTPDACTVIRESVDLKSDEDLPKTFSLSQNYPNPFNPITMIKYQLPKGCQVKLTIYNILGRKVVTLVDEKQKAGYKTIRWNSRGQSGNEVASGIYFYRLKAGDFTKTKKMVLIR